MSAKPNPKPAPKPTLLPDWKGTAMVNNDVIEAYGGEEAFCRAVEIEMQRAWVQHIADLWRGDTG